VLGKELVPVPDAAHAAGGDPDVAQGELLGNAKAAFGGVLQRIIEDGFFDLRSQPVGVWPLGAGHPVEQALGPVGLEVPADFIELLAGVSHHLAGLGNVVELGGKFEQAELAASGLLFSGHVCFSGLVFVVKNPYQNDMAAVCFRGPQLSGEYHHCTT